MLLFIGISIMKALFKNDNLNSDVIDDFKIQDPFGYRVYYKKYENTDWVESDLFPTHNSAKDYLSGMVMYDSKIEKERRI